MSAPVFVVGTGRCGSTLLSNLLREHPAVASLSEVWSAVTDLGGRIAEAFPAAPLDGAAFWAIVGGIPPKAATMHRHGVSMDEVLFRPPPGSRFADGVPALLQTALPHLSDAPEALFDEVAAFAVAGPVAPVADHYRRLFGWLARRHDKRLWVERSGGSLRLVARLHAAFPDARFVHLVRDGRDAALSMSRHPGFRMALVAAQLTEILGVDPYHSPDRTAEADLPDELVPFLPERFDAEAFRRYDTPPALCGHYWSGEIVAGLGELAAVPAERRLTLRYEDLVTEPVATLGRLTAFLGDDLHDDALAGAAARMVRRVPSRVGALPETERRWLEGACAPGFAALGALYTEFHG